MKETLKFITSKLAKGQIVVYSHATNEKGVKITRRNDQSTVGDITYYYANSGKYLSVSQMTRYGLSRPIPQ